MEQTAATTPTKGGFLKQRAKYIFGYGLDTYYDALEDYTLRTTIVSLSANEGMSLQQLTVSCMGSRQLATELPASLAGVRRSNAVCQLLN
jgi:hypothetical protein